MNEKVNHGSEKFTYETSRCGIKIDNCFFVASRYYKPNNLCLSISNDSGIVEVCTKNNNEKSRDDIIKIDKDNIHIIDFLIKMGIIHSQMVMSEYCYDCWLRSYELTEKGLELFKGI